MSSINQQGQPTDRVPLHVRMLLSLYLVPGLAVIKITDVLAGWAYKLARWAGRAPDALYDAQDPIWDRWGRAFEIVRPSTGDKPYDPVGDAPEVRRAAAGVSAAMVMLIATCGAGLLAVAPALTVAGDWAEWMRACLLGSWRR